MISNNLKVRFRQMLALEQHFLLSSSTISRAAEESNGSRPFQGQKRPFELPSGPSGPSFHKLGAAIAAGGAVLLVGLYTAGHSHGYGHGQFLPLLKTCHLDAARGNAAPPATLLEPPERADLPTVTLEEVRRHGRQAERVWVTYKQGVYDITDFAGAHPGGDKILLAAGASIEPFWLIYAQHKTEEVMEVLEELRIANLAESDLRASREAMASEDDPFRLDPGRHPALIVNSQRPFNAETPGSLLVDSFATPNPLFFVRNHMPVPQTDESSHRLSLSGIGFGADGEGEEKAAAVSLSVDELRQRFEPVRLVSTIQCAGNRRNDMNNFKKVQGLMWTGTAISTAEWKGCRLRDVLLSAGVRPDDGRIKHVQFEGADVDSEGKSYGASIPFEKAMGPEVIIAYEMNGEPLPQDHGFPIRLIAPGIVGARQVKWLSSIRTSHEESHSHWQRRDYKALPSSVQLGDPMPFETTPSIQEYPVQSAICVPAPGAKLASDVESVTVSGYAWSGGGRGIIRVEISPDGGRTWQCAEMQQCPGQDLEHMWAWTLWSAEVPVPKEARARGQLELVCKATDRAYNSQPENATGIWNVRGLLHNAWHRVPVSLSS